MYEEDIITDKPVRLEIEGRVFTYRPMDAGEQLDRIDEYTQTNSQGVPIQDLKKVTLMKVCRIESVPYDDKFVKEVTGQDKGWKDLTDEGKIVFFRKLNPTILSMIVEAIQKIDSGKGDDLKNC